MAKKTGRNSSRYSSPTKKVGWSKTAKAAAVLAALTAAAVMYKGSSDDNHLQNQFNKLYEKVSADPKNNGVIANTWLWLADHSYNWSSGNPLKYGRQGFGYIKDRFSAEYALKAAVAAAKAGVTAAGDDPVKLAAAQATLNKAEEALEKIQTPAGTGGWRRRTRRR
jgi:hypothetical protein